MLRKHMRSSSGRTEWALMSVKDPSKVLKWFGSTKPSLAQVAKEEARVEAFKHMKKR